MAAALAEDGYEKFNIQRIVAKDKRDGDFDKTVKILEAAKMKLKGKKPGKGKSDADKK